MPEDPWGVSPNKGKYSGGLGGGGWLCINESRVFERFKARHGMCEVVTIRYGLRNGISVLLP